MGVFDWLSATKTIPDTVKAVSDLYTTDKARLEAESKLQKAIAPLETAQLENNKLLILSEKLFNLGWIPLIGWTCGFLILIYYAPQIVITLYVWGHACIKSGIVSPFPMKPDDILNLIYLLLGFGGYTLVKSKLS